MILSPADARAYLFATFVDDEDGSPHTDLANAGVEHVFDHEPGSGDALRPISVTLFSRGVQPTEFPFEVRVYVFFDAGAREAQVAMDAVLVALCELLPSAAGAETFDVEFDFDLEALVALGAVQVAREDF